MHRPALLILDELIALLAPFSMRKKALASDIVGKEATVFFTTHLLERD
ncbi:MAG: hypothetical protein ABI045_07305 [Flavobacteriales bacterium]